jgi:hypothetical protein
MTELATEVPKADEAENRIEEEYEYISDITLPPTLTETMTMTGIVSVKLDFLCYITFMLLCTAITAEIKVMHIFIKDVANIVSTKNYDSERIEAESTDNVQNITKK